MKNPWEEIKLSDYENHMKSDYVMQLQGLNEMMKGQLETYPVSTVMILGIAGGNGLEHISKNKFVRQAEPRYVSCIIQINVEDNWVSDSPYLHVFDGLGKIHHQIEEKVLDEMMSEMDYHKIKSLEHMLPGGKKLLQTDFERKL